MKKIIFCIIFCMLITITVIPISGENITRFNNKENIKLSTALIPPDLNSIKKNTISSPNPGFYETSEYMIGNIAVGEIFLESNGAIDPDTEIWAPHEELNAQMEIGYALTEWWESQNPNANVDFVYFDVNKIPTSYEPIIHPSGVTDDTYEQKWVNESMAYLGYFTGDWIQRTRSYINDLRQNSGADWAFAIFIIDSTNDFGSDPSTPGSFSDGYNAYAYTGGPFCVLTYNNGIWGISNMDKVIAHETGHIFWATEEYNNKDEYSGYLNEKDEDDSGCLMDTNAFCLSDGTKKQIGWRDTDGDNILDIVDTNPNTDLYSYSPDPTSDTTLIYHGVATVVPYPNNNPSPWDSGNDVTINTIANIKYKVNSGAWLDAIPEDGSFDSHTEEFTMTIGPLTEGTHTITAMAINSVGNSDTTPATDSVTIVTSNIKPNKPNKPSGQTSGKINTEYIYTTTTTDPEGYDLYYWFDWGDGSNSGWIGPYNSGDQASATHKWTLKDSYDIRVKAKDEYDLESDWSDSLTIQMPKTFTYNPLIEQLQKIFQHFPFFEKILNQII